MPKSTESTTTRHSTFYFDEPETLIFKVGGVLFRPHTFLLRRYSEFFEDMLFLHLGMQGEGYSDSLPILLGDVHLADGDYPEITAEEFELALSVMYPEVFAKNPPKFPGQWCKVLDVARRWQSRFLRGTAIAHLAKSGLHASVRLAISTKYDVPEWLPDILLGLCLQSSFPSHDMAHLPPSLIPPFCSAREEFRSYLVSTVTARSLCHKRCAWSSTYREQFCQYLSGSLSCTLGIGKPDHSSFAEVFESLLCKPFSCSDCASRWKRILVDCEAFGESLVQKRCFPKGKGIFQGRGVIVRTSAPADVMTCSCGRTCSDSSSSSESGPEADLQSESESDPQSDPQWGLSDYGNSGDSSESD